MVFKSVLVTGANGFLGSHIAHYFAIHGWKTYGLVRNARSSPPLLSNEIIPIVGDYAAPEQAIAGLAFDVIVSTTEDNDAYEKHFEQLIRLFKTAAKTKRPLVLFTSGNKDYGQGDASHWMHEDSPLNPPDGLRARCFTALEIFQHNDFFDAVLIRPCMVYGYTGSYYTSILAQGALKDEILMDGPPDVIWHGIHVDDVASAYLTIATILTPSEAHGQVFNVSNDDYETFADLASAVAQEYGGKVIQHKPYEGGNRTRQLSAFSQAVSSQRLRALGWRPRKLGFIEGLQVYKAAFDQALAARDPAVVRLVNEYLGDQALQKDNHKQE